MNIKKGIIKALICVAFYVGFIFTVAVGVIVIVVIVAIDSALFIPDTIVLLSLSTITNDGGIDRIYLNELNDRHEAGSIYWHGRQIRTAIVWMIKKEATREKLSSRFVIKYP